MPDWFSDAFDQSMQGVDRSVLSFSAANDSSWSNVHGFSQGLDYLHNLNTLARADLMQDASSAWHQFASHPGASLWSMAVGAAHNVENAAAFLSNAAQFVFTNGLDDAFGTNFAQTTGSQAWANQFVSDVKNVGLGIAQDYRLFTQGNMQQQARMLANGTEGFLQAGAGLFVGAGAARGLSWLGDLGVDSQVSLRTRVLANIADTRAGINATGFPVLTAKIDQMAGGYLPDQWKMISLKKGDLVYGGLPGQSAYYTSEKTLLASNYSRELLFESLQVRPDPVRGFRPVMGVYEVTQDTRVPTGIVKANSTLGVGGGDQFFIDNFSTSLNLINRIELGEDYEHMSIYRPSR